MKLDASHVNSVIFVFSRNFPEIAWRAFKAARRLMLFCGVCGFQRWNRLAALLYPPGNAWRLTQFSGFLLELPGGKDQPPGDANLFPRFWYFRGPRLILFRRKANQILKEWLRYHNVGIITKFK